MLTLILHKIYVETLSRTVLPPTDRRQAKMKLAELPPLKIQSFTLTGTLNVMERASINDLLRLNE